MSRLGYHKATYIFGMDGGVDSRLLPLLIHLLHLLHLPEHILVILILTLFELDVDSVRLIYVLLCGMK